MAEPGLVIRQESNVTIVAFEGATIIDAERIEQIAADLYDLIDKQRAHRLVLDFSNVKLLASRMLGEVSSAPHRMGVASASNLSVLRSMATMILLVSSMSSRRLTPPSKVVSLSLAPP